MPSLAHAVITNRADGVINFTASHDPPEYNGIKFSTPDGCRPSGSHPEVRGGNRQRRHFGDVGDGDSSTCVAAVSRSQDRILEAPRRNRRSERDQEIRDKACVRSDVGASRGYSDDLLRSACIEVATVHDYRDVVFGGHAPEPDDHLLEDLR